MSIFEKERHITLFPPGALLTVFLCVLLGGFRAASAAPYLEALTTARSAAAKIFRIIERVPSIDSSSEMGRQPEKMIGGISFKNVVFSYPSRAGVPILKDFNLDVRIYKKGLRHIYNLQIPCRYLLEKQLHWSGLPDPASQQLSSCFRGFMIRCQV